MFKNALFKKIEAKTNINKDTIMSLASKLQANNLKDKDTLKDVIKEIGTLTGKEISEEKTNKIINTIVNDDIPKDIDKML